MREALVFFSTVVSICLPRYTAAFLLFISLSLPSTNPCLR